MREDSRVQHRNSTQFRAVKNKISCLKHRHVQERISNKFYSLACIFNDSNVQTRWCCRCRVTDRFITKRINGTDLFCFKDPWNSFYNRICVCVIWRRNGRTWDSLKNNSWLHFPLNSIGFIKRDRLHCFVWIFRVIAVDNEFDCPEMIPFFLLVMNLITMYFVKEENAKRTIKLKISK